MPLNKSLLKQLIESAFKESRGSIQAPDDAPDDAKNGISSIEQESDQKISTLADKLANAIDTYIKQATVTTPIQTNVIGTSPSGPVAGTGTGVGTGTIS